MRSAGYRVFVRRCVDCAGWDGGGWGYEHDGPICVMLCIAAHRTGEINDRRG